MKINMSNFTEHDSSVRAAALHAFRRRQKRKTTVEVLGLLVLFALVTATFLARSPARTTAKFAPVRQPVHMQKATVAQSVPSPRGGFISDDELLAAFPPGSCFIAEVNGQKRLVFRDPQIQKRFFN